MEVVEVKNGVELNRKFDNFRVQTVFQSADMLDNVSNFRYLIKCRARVRSFAVLNNNRDAIVLIHTRIRGNICHLLGSIENFDYVDCVYGSISDETLRDALDVFLQYLSVMGIKELSVKFMDEQSKTYRALKLLSESKYSFQENDVQNLSIKLDGYTYDDFFSTLGKHVRQNIRTAYNRLNKDGKEISLVFVVGGERKMERYPCIKSA